MVIESHKKLIDIGKNSKYFENVVDQRTEDDSSAVEIYINSGEKLLEQSHNHRDEYWKINSGKSKFYHMKKCKKKKNDHIFIGKNIKNKIINNTEKPAVIIEIQTGIILSEDDIISYNDK